MKRKIEELKFTDKFLSIYIHIPFCKKKCNYCDFYSISKLNLTKDFVKAIIKEFINRKFFLNNFNIQSIYIGGGSPSVLDVEELEFLLKNIARYIDFQKLLEFNFEVNPESINIDKVNLLKDFNINRISLGAQSINDKNLSFLGRVHSYKDFLKAYDLMRDHFEINIDLIYGLPNQKKQDFLKELKEIISLKPHHISLYALEIHESTKFYGKISIEDEVQKDIYFASIDFLEGNGYIQYEISNFSLNGFHSIHNENYWYRGNYIGFGPSASSCFNDLRWKNISDLSSYISSLNNGKIELEYIEQLSFKDIMNEKLMLLLRTRKGIYEKSDVYDFFDREIKKCYKDGYLEYINGFFRLKKEYIFVFNRVVSSMIK